jgi:hypothetical protein
MRISLLLLLIAGLVPLHVAGNIDDPPVAQVSRVEPSNAEILKRAHSIFIRSKSFYFKPATLENALLKKEEFQRWGIAITRVEQDADLIIEVDRKVFTTRFVYSVIEPSTYRVVASGNVTSLGGTVEGKISSSLVKKWRAVR